MRQGLGHHAISLSLSIECSMYDGAYLGRQALLLGLEITTSVIVPKQIA